MKPAQYLHVDVFAAGPLTGNGLTVFPAADGWNAAFMQTLTREMRQFESIFLSGVTERGGQARIFTVDEELPFAGHPVLGAAAVLHELLAPARAERDWTLQLPHGPVTVRTRARGDHYCCEMDQGRAQTGPELSAADVLPVLTRLGLQARDLTGAPPRVVSTGLPYLILPLGSAALVRARITGTDLEERLAELGAKFVLVLDPENREMRTWDNLGLVEDVATGSAAGPACAYLLQHGLVPGASVDLHQGRCAGRPSLLRTRIDDEGRVHVRGDVRAVATGLLSPAVLTLADGQP